MCMCAFPSCKPVHYICAVTSDARRGHQICRLELQTVLTNQLCGCWKYNSSPQEEQRILLPFEPSPQSSTNFFMNFKVPHFLAVNNSIIRKYYINGRYIF